MNKLDELNALSKECDRLSKILKQEPIAGYINRIGKAIEQVAESSANSWIGHQSKVYYRDFKRPAQGDYFSKEWGFNSIFAHPVSDNWTEVDYEDVYERIMQLAGNPDTNAIEKAGSKALEAFEQNRDELINILTIILNATKNSTFEELRGEVKNLKCFSEAQFIKGIAPSSTITRDYAALEQGRVPPHHIRVLAWLMAQSMPFQNLGALGKIVLRAASFLDRLQKTSQKASVLGHCIFIGHGRDPQWKDVAAFISTRLKIPFEEFNRQPAAGMTISDRLQEMLRISTFAFLIMTAEDEHADETKHARENVIHEIGLFQQKLGSRKAIVLLEDGCSEFSNIAGIVQIRFAKGYIKSTYEDIRQVLEREGVLPCE